MNLPEDKRDNFIEMLPQEMDQCLVLKEDQKLFYVSWSKSCREKFGQLKQDQKDHCLSLPEDLRSRFVEKMTEEEMK